MRAHGSSVAHRNARLGVDPRDRLMASEPNAGPARKSCSPPRSRNPSRRAGHSWRTPAPTTIVSTGSSRSRCSRPRRRAMPMGGSASSVKRERFRASAIRPSSTGQVCPNSTTRAASRKGAASRAHLELFGDRPVAHFRATLTQLVTIRSFCSGRRTKAVPAKIRAMSEAVLKRALERDGAYQHLFFIGGRTHS
jgi:hypothetical protein